MFDNTKKTEASLSKKMKLLQIQIHRFWKNSRTFRNKPFLGILIFIYLFIHSFIGWIK